MVKINKSGHRGRYNNAHTGKYRVKHPEKYMGEFQPEYKSSLELKMMIFLDNNPMIAKWSYEGFSIKYMDKSSNPPKPRNYHIDFIAYAKKADGGLKQLWIEVKSQAEVVEPKREKTLEYRTWVKNQCKWKAAKMLAESRGCQFKVITERQLD